MTILMYDLVNKLFHPLSEDISLDSGASFKTSKFQELSTVILLLNHHSPSSQVSKTHEFCGKIFCGKILGVL